MTELGSATNFTPFSAERSVARRAIAAARSFAAPAGAERTSLIGEACPRLAGGWAEIALFRFGNIILTATAAAASWALDFSVASVAAASTVAFSKGGVYARPEAVAASAAAAAVF